MCFCKPFVLPSWNHLFLLNTGGLLQINMRHISSSFLSTFQLTELGCLPRRFDSVPRSRSRAAEPLDNGSFILPLKQSFMKNRRIMDSTARLVALLSGWSGNCAPIETNLSVLAKHMGKSIRQIQRMLNDAMREGYLRIGYQKSRVGMITGIVIYLRFDRLRKQRKGDNSSKSRRKQATTERSNTNKNQYLFSKDEGLEERLRQMALTMGVDYPPDLWAERSPEVKHNGIKGFWQKAIPRCAKYKSSKDYNWKEKGNGDERKAGEGTLDIGRTACKVGVLSRPKEE